MNYFNKLVYKIATAILLPIIIVSAILAYKVYGNITKNTEEKHIEYLENVVRNYVEYLDNTFEKISYAVSKDVMFLENTESNTSEELFKITSNNLLADSIVYASGIAYDNHMYDKNRELAFFYSIKKGNDVVKLEVNDEISNGKKNYLAEDYDWWTESATKYTGGWTNPYYDTLAGETEMVTYFKPFFFDSKFAGVVTMDISLGRLESWLLRNEKYIERDFNATTILISQDSIVVYSEIKQRIGSNIYDTIYDSVSKYNTTQALEVLTKAINGETGYQIVNAYDGKKSFIVFYAPLKSTKWTAISVIPYSVVSEAVFKSASKTIGLIFAFLIFIIIVVISISNYVSKPIVKLSQLSLKIAEGDYNTKIKIRSKNEIGVLADNFKIMKKSLLQREQELTESNKRYEVIFNNSPVGIIYFNNKLDVLSHNKKFIEIIGLDANTNLIGENVADLPFIQGNIAILRKTFSEGKEYTYTTNLMHRKDAHINVKINPVILKNKKYGLIVTVEDITEQRKNTELRIKTKAAEKANESKSLFLANMSHEIRTPMNAIIGLSDLMQKTTLDNKQKNYLSKISSSSKLLLGIINDILDFSKIEAGKLTLELQTFNLEQILIDINNIFSYTASKKGLEFILFLHPDVPHVVVGDELRLKQIIINLLSNAIKFTDKGEIEVSIKLKEKNDNNLILLFEVKDTGIGMTQEQQTKIFNVFSQADESTTRKYGGTGLGLSISKKLVELMNGEIGLKSEPNVGTTFFFDAQLKSGKQENNISYISTPDLRDIKVIVCDDNKSARYAVSSILKSFTFHTSEVANGILLLEKLESSSGEPFELIILDLHIPGIDGIEVAKRIANSTKIVKKPKIILLTTYSEVNFEEKELIGIDSVLYKPVSNSVLFDTIMDVFGKNIPRHNSASQNEETSKKLKEYTGIRILLVDDNEINQEVATELIQSLGIVVDIAGNGKIASEKIFNSGTPSKYSLIFMDLQMPIMDGYTATRKIKSNKNYQKLPIVAMTADVMEGVKEKCLELGMSGFVSKPINPTEVVKAIINWAIKPEASHNVKHIEEPDKTITTNPKIDLSKLSDINIEDGMNRINHNSNLYAKILLKFAHNYIGIIDELIVEIENNNLDVIKAKIHTLKGIAGNIGANKLHQNIMVIEEKFKNSIPENAKELVLSLQGYLLTVINSINNAIIEELHEAKSQTENPLLTSETKIKISEIITLLEESDSDGISKLENLNLTGKHSANNKLIKEALDNYDFDKAIELLNIILENE